MALTKLEQENLAILLQDVSLTIEKYFSNFDKEAKQRLESLLPFFIIFYFKILKHDPKNKDWEHTDEVCVLNNLFHILKNILEVHTGYISFEKILEYLKNNSFSKSRNSLFEMVCLLEIEREKNKNHTKNFYVLLEEKDIIENNIINELEYISKNNFSEIIFFVVIKSEIVQTQGSASQSGINFYFARESKPIIKDNKLNQKINNLGYETILINANDMKAIDQAVICAKDLKKPSMIFLNIS